MRRIIRSVIVSVVLGGFTVAAAQLPAPNCEEWNTGEFFETATVEDVTACLAAGADVAARDGLGYTPLHLAAELNGNPAVIEVLLKGGADSEARDSYQDTPLQRAAAFNENPMILQALLKGGADPNARDEYKGTPLHWAARYNENPMIIQALLEGGADPEARNVNEATPLEIAKHFNNVAVIEILQRPGGPPILSAQDCRMWPTSMFFQTATVESVKACLEAGVAPMVRNESEETPLHVVAQHSKTPGVIEALLAAGADPNAQTEDKWTPLHSAAKSKNVVAIQALLDAGADVEASTDHGSTTPLLVAAGSGNVAVIQALLAAGADVDVPERGGYTALYLAVRAGNVPVIKTLLAAGADPMKHIWGLGAGGGDSTTPLDLAYDLSSSVELLQAAVEMAGQDCKLWNTKQYFQATTPESVTACLGAGSNPREEDVDGVTPLHRAAGYNENPAVIQMLLNAGADLESQHDTGYTPLRWAINPKFWDEGGNANLAVIQTLLDFGADPNVREERRGGTLLHVALREIARAYNRQNRASHYPAVIQMLLDAGADMEALDRLDRTPLFRAVDLDIPAAVTKALLAAGADIAALDHGGNTPLHEAVVRSNPDLVEVLLDAGADPLARNAAGETPWDLAQRDEYLRGTDAYRRLNDARSNRP